MSELDVMYSIILVLLFWTAYNLGKVSARLEAINDKDIIKSLNETRED